MKHQDSIILGICEAFMALGDAFTLAEMDANDLDEFLRNIEPLTDAVKREDWDLIAEAAQMQAKLPRAEMFVDIQIRKLAARIYWNPHDFGIEGKANKADILEVIETHYPFFFIRLPTSKRGLTDWWKKVDCPAKQSRGYSSRANKENS